MRCSTPISARCKDIIKESALIGEETTQFTDMLIISLQQTRHHCAKIDKFFRKGKFDFRRDEMSSLAGCRPESSFTSHQRKSQFTLWICRSWHKYYRAYTVRIRGGDAHGELEIRRRRRIHLVLEGPGDRVNGHLSKLRGLEVSNKIMKMNMTGRVLFFHELTAHYRFDQL